MLLALDLDDYLRSLRRGWWIVLSCAAIGGVFAVALADARLLRSSARVVLAPSADLVGDGARVSTAQSINPNVVNTLADVLVSRSVVVAARQDLGLDAVERDRYDVTATIGQESRVVDVAVEGPDGGTARKLAGAVVDRGAALFVDLYDIYRVDVIEQPRVAVPVGVSAAGVTLVGVALGLAVGVALAVIRERLGAAMSVFGVLIVVVGVIVLTAGVARPALGVMLLAGLEVTRASLVVEELHGVPSFIVPYALLLLVVGLVRRPRDEPFGPEVMVPVVVLACYGVVLLSGVLDAPRPTVVWAGVQAYAKELMVVAALVVLVRTPAMLRAAVWGAVLAGALLGAVNVWQHLTGTFDTTWWGFARPVFGVVDGVSRHRIGGPLASPNSFAQTMVVVFALAGERAWHESRRWVRLLAAATAAVSALTIAFTSSRGGWLALGAVLLAFAWRVRPRASTVVAAVAIVALVVVVSPARYRSLATSLVRPVLAGDQREDGSFAVRAEGLEIGFAMFVDHPVLGVGWRQFEANYLTYARELGIESERRERSAHGLVLAVATESGLIGLAAFGVILAVALTSVARARRRLLTASDPTGRELVEGVQIALVGLLVAALFLPMATPQAMWFTIALAFCVRQLRGEDAASPSFTDAA